MKNKIRFIIWITVTLSIFLVFLSILIPNEVQWKELVAYIIILSAIGGIYEVWQWLKKKSSYYRYAFIIGFLGAFFIGWANGAVGIIGNEDNPANLMYVAIFIVGLIGSLISRFKPHGMSITLFAVALVQLAIPFIALFIWPAKASWGGAGVIGVFIINAIFALLFIASGILFRHASLKNLNKNEKDHNRS